MLPQLDTTPPKAKRGANVPVVPFERMTLRDRKKVDTGQPLSRQESQSAASVDGSKKPSSTVHHDVKSEVGSDEGPVSVVVNDVPEGGNGNDSIATSVGGASGSGKAKKVILHVKPPSQRGT